MFSIMVLFNHPCAATVCATHHLTTPVTLKPQKALRNHIELSPFDCVLPVE